MNNFIEQVIEETFKSQAQQGLFFAKAKHSKKWQNMANEFADKTDWSKKLPKYVKKGKKKSSEEQILSKEVHNGEVDEIVDADGNIQTGDEPGNPNAYIRSKKTTDQVAKATMGQMGSFGVLGGATGANKTLKYWAEADMSKALGNEIKNDSDMDLKDAVEYFEDDLEVKDKEEATERAQQLGFDDDLPEGEIRLVENPLKYIEEYLTKKGRDGELVKKHPIESAKKVITPIIRRQLGSMKQALKSNNLTVSDITEYLEDNE
jgi:hypothetical protein